MSDRFYGECSLHGCWTSNDELACPVCERNRCIIVLQRKGTNPKDLVGAKKLPVLSVIPTASILYEAAAMRNGAEKYNPFNYRAKPVQAMTYVDASLRHIMAWVDGEELAPDSLVHHLGHAKATLGIIIDAIENKCLVDNRPKGNGAASRILAANDRSGK